MNIKMKIKIQRRNFLSWARLLGIWCLILLFLGLIAEGVLQMVPYPGKTTLVHYVDEDLGIWHKPHQLAARYSACYSVEDLYINSLGMRAAEVDSTKALKIAYFGDSMLEGVQVSQQDHFIYQLNAQDSIYDHLNFGMSATGTTAQWVHFLHFSQQLPFKKVYLFFYLANDIRNNSLPLEQRANSGNRGYLAHWIPNGAGGFNLDKNYSGMSRWHWLKRSRVIQQLNTLRHAITRSPNGKPMLTSDMDVFRHELPTQWLAASRVSRHAVQVFAAGCEAQGIDFTLVLLPSIFELMNVKEQLTYLGTNAEVYDMQGPYKRWRSFLAEENIAFIDGYVLAKAFIEDRGLTYPYLSYACDGHFSPLGHTFLKELIAY